MPTTAETYRKTYAERHLDRLRANYERAVEEWERGAAIDQREADWIEEQIKAQHDYVYRLKKAEIKSGDVSSAMDIVNAQAKLFDKESDNIKSQHAHEKDASSRYEAPTNIMTDLFSISPEVSAELEAAMGDGHSGAAMTVLRDHMRAKGVAATVGTLGAGQRMAAAIAFEAELNQLTRGAMPDQIKELMSDQFAIHSDLIDAGKLARMKEAEVRRVRASATAPIGGLRTAVGNVVDQGAGHMDALRAVDPTIKKAEDDLAALVERREALDAGLATPTEEDLRARAVELTGPMLSRKARREKRARLLSGPSDEDKIIASLTARAETYLNETADPDEDHSEAGEMAIRLQDMMGSGALDPRDMMDRATEFAGNDMGYRDEIIMRVFAHDMSRTRRKAYREIPEQVGQEGPEFQAADMEQIAPTAEEVAPEQ